LNKEAFLLIQRIRDEAHRFAITSHRKKRQKQSLHSSLEDIPGIGKLRRFQILKHFGGLQEVQKASVEDLSKVPGISQSIAQKIYEALHGS
jgi:excinuclease ABC subunit C